MADFAPFHNQPYVGERGCVVLVSQVLEAHGISYPHVERPEDAEGWQRVARAQPLDVVVFNEPRGGLHVGVCMDQVRFLHVQARGRSFTEYLTSPVWCNRIEGIYRYTARTA